MEFEDKKQTKFNAALSSLERLHDLLRECNEYSRLCRINGFDVRMLAMWRDTIIAIYREIFPKLDKMEKDNVKRLLQKSKRFGSVNIIKKTPEGSYSVVNPIVFNKYWILYSRTEAYLRRVADEYGMLVPDKTDDILEPENW